MTTPKWDSFIFRGDCSSLKNSGAALTNSNSVITRSDAAGAPCSASSSLNSGCMSAMAFSACLDSSSSCGALASNPRDHHIWVILRKGAQNDKCTALELFC